MSDDKTWFVIGDADFALLDDDEFAQVWAALSVVMRRRALEKIDRLDRTRPIERVSS